MLLFHRRRRSQSFIVPLLLLLLLVGYCFTITIGQFQSVIMTTATCSLLLLLHHHHHHLLNPIIMRSPFSKNRSISIITAAASNHNNMHHQWSKYFSRMRLHANENLDDGNTDERSRKRSSVNNMPSINKDKTRKTRYTYSTPPDGSIHYEQVEEMVATLALLTGPVTHIKGIGPRTAVSLAKLGLTSPLKLLFHFPVKGLDRRHLIENLEVAQVSDGTYVSVMVTVEDYPRGRIPKAVTRDEGGNRVDILYFYRGNRGGAAVAALKMLGPIGSKRLVCGIVKRNMYGGSFQCYDIVNPDIIETLEEESRQAVLKVEPVYKLTKGVSQKRMISAIQGALQIAKPFLDFIPESLPTKLLSDLSWPTISDAILRVHSPRSLHEIGVNAPARKRLAFEELCIQQARLGLIRDIFKRSQSYGPLREVDYELRSKWKSTKDSPLLQRCIASLPYELTTSQLKCLDEIYHDTVCSKLRMARLLQGDVGCGKTIVAFLAGLGCIDAGFGKVLLILAPTTLLADQHVQSIQLFLDNMSNSNNQRGEESSIHLNVKLFTGGLSTKNREEFLKQMQTSSDNEAFVVVGTHTLLTADVAARISSSSGLALTIIDEEQRFGVKQREILSSVSRHTLYMSATPIPRTIALGGSLSSSLVGTLDISSISQRPKSARKVQTNVVSEEMTEELIKGVQRQLKIGAKAFWIVPAIGDNEDNQENDNHEESEATVMKRHAILASSLGERSVTYIHGRMSIEERTEKLREFAKEDSGVDVIVGTTVLEVGIDIPWVTLLIVEGAERFGLSQLHQLRGRVGRASSIASKGRTANLECHFTLIASTKTVNAGHLSMNIALQRLKILKETSDGYRIAEEDYKIRGPGDLFGTLQAGAHNLSCTNIQYHYGMLSAASKFGRSFLVNEPLATLCDQDNSQIATKTPEYGSDVLHGSKREGRVLESHIDKHYFEPFYSKAFRADNVSGLTLRIGIFLFGATGNDESGSMMTISETLIALQELQKLEENSKGKKLSTLDDLFLELAATY